MTTGPVPRVEVHESAADLATSVAGAFLRAVTVLQDVGEIPRVALTGGTIADAIHREIARLGADTDVDWSRIDFFWGDERFVAPDSPDRNALQAHEAFLDLLGVDPARVHEIPSTADAASVDAAAASYADTVRAAGTGNFHVLMLGVGPDGHIASLFPGHPQLDVDDLVAVGVTDSPKPPPERVSLTFPALNRADEVWFVVSGADKAEPVGRALAATPPGCPRDPSCRGPRPGRDDLVPRPRRREPGPLGGQREPVTSTRGVRSMAMPLVSPPAVQSLVSYAGLVLAPGSPSSLHRRILPSGDRSLSWLCGSRRRTGTTARRPRGAQGKANGERSMALLRRSRGGPGTRRWPRSA